ncbi:MAG: hypothetical protein NC349_10220 [Paenibacillus sp.]|nr:hypothetical protein [Paenibacillus sp.]
MKKTTTSKYPANLPISRNAYKRFINRIISVFADDPAGMSEMITAFDSYLTDPASPIIFINPSMRVAFSFLRQDINVAIERSRRARQRALARKASATPEDTSSPAHVAATTPEATTEIEPTASTNPEKESPATTTHKQETSTPPTVTKKASPAPHHHRKNTRNTSTSHPSRHTTRKRKLKFNKPGQ